jgi:hypothetical protein
MIAEILDGEASYEQTYYFIFIMLDFFILFESFNKVKHWGDHFKIVTYMIAGCFLTQLVSLWLVLHNSSGFEDMNFYFLIAFTLVLIYIALLEFRFFENLKILKEVRNKHDNTLVKSFKIFEDFLSADIKRSDKKVQTVGLMIVCLALASMCLTYSAVKYSQNSSWF